MRFVTSDGTHVSICQESGLRGGEGIVFKIEDNPNLVAKIIHADKMSPVRQRKIEAMIKDKPHLDFTMFDERTRKHVPTVAWPISGLYQDGSFRGFVMNAVNQEEALSLAEACNPVVRRDIEWNEWDPQLDLVLATAIARNLALAVGQAHQANIVIGDLSNNNVLVSRSLIVTLIDCDSMQFTDRSGHLHYCTGTTRSFRAPEVPMPSPTTGPTKFQPQSDLFALAVHIYYLLIGRHPFANGAFSDSYDQPDPDLLAKQGEWRGKKGGLLKVEPGTLDPQTFLPAYMVEMFVRAFEGGLTDPMKRPTAAQWLSALEDFANGSSHRQMRGIQRCANTPSHSFPGFLADCPTCGKDSKASASPPITQKPKRSSLPSSPLSKVKKASAKKLPKTVRPATPPSRPPTVKPVSRPAGKNPPTVKPAPHRPRENPPSTTPRPVPPPRQSPSPVDTGKLLRNISMRIVSGALIVCVVYLLALGVHSLLFQTLFSAAVGDRESLVTASVAFANSSAATALLSGLLIAIVGTDYYLGWLIPGYVLPVAFLAPARNNFVWPSSAEWLSPPTQFLTSFMWPGTKTAAIILIISAIVIWGIAISVHPTSRGDDWLNRVFHRLLGEASTYDYTIGVVGLIAFMVASFISPRIRLVALTRLLEGRLLLRHTDVFDVSLRDPHVYALVSISAITCLILLTASIALVVNLKWRQRMISVISAVLIYALVLFMGVPTTQALWNTAEQKTAHALRQTPARVEDDSTVCAYGSKFLKAEDGKSWLWQAYATTGTASSTCDVLTIYRGRQHVRNLSYTKNTDRGITLESVTFTGDTENDGTLTVNWSSGDSIELSLVKIQAAD